MTVETPVVDSTEDEYALPPTTYSRMHVLAPAPVASFDGKTYPSLDLREGDGPVAYSDVRVTVTGNAAERAEFARQLRAVADAIAAWTSDV